MRRMTQKTWRQKDEREEEELWNVQIQLWTFELNPI